MKTPRDTVPGAGADVPGSQAAGADAGRDGKPIDHVDTTDGASTGTHFEPGTDQGGAPGPAAAAEPATEEGSDKKRPKHFADETRQALADKARKQREEQLARDREEHPDVAAHAAAMSGQPGGEPGGGDGGGAPAAPAAAAPAAAEQKPLAKDEETITIKVNGEERTLTVAQAKAELQKGIVGDARLKQAAALRAELDAREQRLTAEKARIDAEKAAVEKARKDAGGSGAPAKPSDLPGPGDRTVVDEEAVSRQVAALYSGNPDKAKAAIQEIIAAARRGEHGSTLSTDDVAQKVLEALDARDTERRAAEAKAAREREILDANTAFKTSFQDLASNPQHIGFARAEFARLSADPAYAHLPLLDVVKQTGVNVRKALNIPDPADKPLEKQLTDRKDMKRTIPDPTRAAARSPAPAPKKAMTPAEVVAAQRRARGQ